MATIQQREELHRTIWSMADELRGAIGGWEFKAYVLGTLFYRFISENLTDYINRLQEETRQFIAQSFADGFVTTTGVAITKVLPPMPIFGGGKVNREEKKKTVLEKLSAFFVKYFNI